MWITRGLPMKNTFSQRRRRERYKWYQLEKPAQDRDVAGGLCSSLEKIALAGKQKKNSCARPLVHKSFN